MARPKGARDADYQQKRAQLLERMIPTIMQRELARPSLRQLAEAAGVTVSTLRHYFGSRAELVSGALELMRAEADGRLQTVSQPVGDFETSVRDYVQSLLRAIDAPRRVPLGDLFAVSLAEGLLDPRIGPSTLGFILDPTLDALAARLQAHLDRGEMRPCDVRAASLMLVSPLLLAILHQNHMGGSDCRPLNLNQTTDEICTAFVAAYSTQPSPTDASG